VGPFAVFELELLFRSYTATVYCYKNRFHHQEAAVSASNSKKGGSRRIRRLAWLCEQTDRQRRV